MANFQEPQIMFLINLGAWPMFTPPLCSTIQTNTNPYILLVRSKGFPNLQMHLNIRFYLSREICCKHHEIYTIYVNKWKWFIKSYQKIKLIYCYKWKEINLSYVFGMFLSVDLYLFSCICLSI